MNKYRFDNSYSKVYRLIHGDYCYIGSYHAYGINADMEEDEMIRLAQIGEEIESTLYPV